MNRSAFSIVLLAVFADVCVAEIIIKTSQSPHQHLYEAAIDISMTCFGDPGSAVAIVGDSDGFILKTLRSRYFIPVVLINHMSQHPIADPPFPHELQTFVIAFDSVDEAYKIMYRLRFTVWWNQYAHFLFVDMSPDPNSQCSDLKYYMYTPLRYGVLNAQFICYHGSNVHMFNFNPFTRQAPPVWTWITAMQLGVIKTPINIFHRFYQKGGQVCESLNFPKTMDIGGYPLTFLTTMPVMWMDMDSPISQIFMNDTNIHKDLKEVYKSTTLERRWFMDNIAKVMNATPVLLQYGREGFNGGHATFRIGITIDYQSLSSSLNFRKVPTRNKIFSLHQVPVYAMTDHTAHKSQLYKILTVIDRNSRIGMLVVYLITFVFFKLFLGETVMQALMNLVRLTSNTGIAKLPKNLAPTIYLACLLMFVVTLQGIFTGNLAMLLTTTIPYKNVETKQDIAYLGYTIYGTRDSIVKLSADPIFEGRFAEISESKRCDEYIRRDPLVACVQPALQSIYAASMLNLHISTHPIVEEYIFHVLTRDNPLGRRLDTITKRFVEHSLWYVDHNIETMRLRYVTDDEVKKNTDRRIMTLHDLGFAFIILGVGLLCAFICFIGEVAIFKIRLKIANRRNRVRARLAWGVNWHSFLSFPSLNLRFNAQRIFSKRR